ncbi:MAG: hypothetical protein ACKVOR_05835 [Flavobacteriales bacterium]
MRNFTKCTIAFILLILIVTNTTAQVRYAYDQLDLSPVTSQFFFPQTLKSIPVPDAFSYADSMSAPLAATLFMAFDKACLDSNAYIANFGDFTDSLYNNATANDAIPISILDVTYHDFISSTITDNLIFLFDGKFFDTPNRPTKGHYMLVLENEEGLMMEQVEVE